MYLKRKSRPFRSITAVFDVERWSSHASPVGGTVIGRPKPSDSWGAKR
jgi:hypothetical protein